MLIRASKLWIKKIEYCSYFLLLPNWKENVDITLESTSFLFTLDIIVHVFLFILQSAYNYV